MSWLLKFTDWTVHYTRAEARFIFNFVRECTCRAIGTVVISYAAQLLVLWTSNSYTGGRTKSKTEQKIKEFNKTKKTRQKKKHSIPPNQHRFHSISVVSVIFHSMCVCCTIHGTYMYSWAINTYHSHTPSVLMKNVLIFFLVFAQVFIKHQRHSFLLLIWFLFICCFCLKKTRNIVSHCQ